LPVLRKKCAVASLFQLEEITSTNKGKRYNVRGPVVLLVLLYEVKGLGHIYLQLKWLPVYQSAIFDQITKWSEVYLCAIMYCACAKFEQNQTMHVWEMVGDAFKEENGRQSANICPCYNSNGHQSAMFDCITKQHDVYM